MSEGGVPGNSLVDPHPEEIQVSSQEIQLAQAVFGRTCLSLAAVAQPVKGTKTVPCHQWRHSLALHQTFRQPGTTLLCEESLVPEFGRVLAQKAEDPLVKATPECPCIRQILPKNLLESMYIW